MSSEKPNWIIMPKVRADMQTARFFCEQHGLTVPTKTIKFVDVEELERMLPADEYAQCIRTHWEARKEHTIKRIVEEKQDE